MNEIKLLDKNTIDKIAAGEVVDRPSSIVKELMENSIDSGANAISVEIKDGGISLIRITDNGCGIDKSQVRKAFLRHSTSKISDASDLAFIRTLGFRGEALSSIAAVSRIELCTKTVNDLTGIIIKLEGGEEVSCQEAGLPNGTTVIVRNIFFNTPARLKFLKSSQTEAGYIYDIVEKIALSHPEIAIKYTSNGSMKLNTSGNNSMKDTVYAVFGRDITSRMREIDKQDSLLHITGFIGNPELARTNRNFEYYFVNGRYVKDKIISAAIEEAYKNYQMKGSFPFTVINITIEPELMDVNVHPSKMEVRFSDNERVYNSVLNLISETIRERDNIPSVSVAERVVTRDIPKAEDRIIPEIKPVEQVHIPLPKAPEPFEENRIQTAPQPVVREDSFSQPSFFEDGFLTDTARKKHRIIGNVFETYWIVEFEDKIYIIDQHAAHEKVLYEQFSADLMSGAHYSQAVSPAIIVSLTPDEESILNRYMKEFNDIGFEISHFGGSEYAISAVPADLYTFNSADLFVSIIDELGAYGGSFASSMIHDRIATAACKAAVKGGNKMSFSEADELIDKLLRLDNPFNCPHGRPTIISISKSELERKFKRIV